MGIQDCAKQNMMPACQRDNARGPAVVCGVHSGSYSQHRVRIWAPRRGAPNQNDPNDEVLRDDEESLASEDYRQKKDERLDAQLAWSTHSAKLLKPKDTLSHKSPPWRRTPI